MGIKFYKYSAAGNDFIIMDQRIPLDKNWQLLASQICDRHFGIGADGLILIGKSNKADFKMTIYNSDGSVAEMCGNGTRAVADFIFTQLDYNKPELALESFQSVYFAFRHDNEFKIQMTEILKYPDFDLSFISGYQNKFFIDTGVPHLVLEVPSLSTIDVAQEGSLWRNHSKFIKGCNVNFIEVRDPNQSMINMRTFERGVEAETLACGTGVIAAALACEKFYGWKDQVSVFARGGKLEAYFDHRHQQIYLQGPTRLVFEGIYFE